MNTDSAEMIDISNVILDNFDITSSETAENHGSKMVHDVLQALYFNVILPSTSLYFFRSKHHLLPVLKQLANHKFYSKEDNFWLRSEDLILRVKTQFSAAELAEIVAIYSKVRVS